MKPSAYLEFAVRFANFCITNSFDVFAVRDLIVARKKYIVANTRQCNGETVPQLKKLQSDYERKVNSIGLTIEFDSLGGSLYDKDHKAVFLPSV